MTNKKSKGSYSKVSASKSSRRKPSTKTQTVKKQSLSQREQLRIGRFIKGLWDDQPSFVLDTEPKLIWETYESTYLSDINFLDFLKVFEQQKNLLQGLGNISPYDRMAFNVDEFNKQTKKQGLELVYVDTTKLDRVSYHFSTYYKIDELTDATINLLKRDANKNNLEIIGLTIRTAEDFFWNLSSEVRDNLSETELLVRLTLEQRIFD